MRENRESERRRRGEIGTNKIDPIYQSQITIVKEEKLCHYTLESKYFPTISLCLPCVCLCVLRDEGKDASLPC